MVAEIKLVVNDFERVVATLVKGLNTNETLFKSVENFQLEANEVLTKIINDKNNLGDKTILHMDDGDYNETLEDEDSDAIMNSPKRKKQ